MYISNIKPVYLKLTKKIIDSRVEYEKEKSEKSLAPKIKVT
jgi:hypothetical protein